MSEHDAPTYEETINSFGAPANPPPLNGMPKSAAVNQVMKTVESDTSALAPGAGEGFSLFV